MHRVHRGLVVPAVQVVHPGPVELVEQVGQPELQEAQGLVVQVEALVRLVQVVQLVLPERRERQARLVPQGLQAFLEPVEAQVRPE